MDVYRGYNYRLNLRQYIAITKEDALTAEETMSSFEEVGDANMFMKFMGTRDRNRMVNNINFVHFYRKNKKEVSYILRCVIDAVGYAIRCGAAENKSGTAITDTILSGIIPFTYKQTRRLLDDYDKNMEILGAWFCKEDIYPARKYIITANDITGYYPPFEDIHSIHLLYIEKDHDLSNQLDLQTTRKPLMQKRRTKELKSFYIKLKNPIHLRLSYFKGISYRGIKYER
jgi:hypothetical protein